MSLGRKHYRYSWRHECWSLYLPSIGMWVLLEDRTKAPYRRD